MSVFDSIQQLWEQELFEEIAFLEQLIPAKERQSSYARNDALMCVYFGDAYFSLEKFHLGTRFYRSALELYPKLRIATHGLTEVDVRFRLHKCLLRQKKYDEAVSVLLKIPDAEQTPKVKLSLYKLLTTRDRGTNTAHHHLPYLQAVANSCPSALHSLSLLLKNGAEVDALVNQIPDGLRETAPVTPWLESQTLIGQNQLHDATQTLSSINTASYRVVLEQGNVYHKLGMKDQAKRAFLRAHAMDEDRCDRMDILAALMAEAKAYDKDLETLALKVISKNEDTVEATIAFGYMSRAMGNNHTQSLHVAYKACSMTAGFFGHAKSEAMLLKAVVLCDLERHEDAIRHLQEALRHDSRCYELHETLVNLFLTKQSIRDAKSATAACLNALPDDPRGQVLKARVLLKAGTNHSKQEAVRILEPIVDEMPYLVDGVCALIDHYDRIANYEKAIGVLTKLTKSSFPVLQMAKFHHMLGDFLTRTQQSSSAYEHINIALTNGREEAQAHMVALDTCMFQTPSPVVANTRYCPPPAPRRQQRSRVPAPVPEMNLDSSAEPSDAAAMDTSNDTTS